MEPHQAGAMLQKCFQRLEALCWEVVVAVAGEAEVDQFPELLALAGGHECRGKFPEGRAEDRRAGLCVGVEIAEIVLHREREERHTVVEDRREGTRFVAPVVDQQSEVAEMPVGVADQRIENHHVAERLIELVAQLLQFGGDLSQFLLREAAVDRHERMIDVREKLAGAAQRSLPFRQLVGDMVHPHRFGDLGGVKFGIRLVAGVRSAGTAALESMIFPPIRRQPLRRFPLVVNSGDDENALGRTLPNPVQAISDSALSKPFSKRL